MKARAKVRPRAWRAAVNRKVGLARQHWYELALSEAPELNRYQDGGTYLGQLVGAARAVFQVTHTVVGNPRLWQWYGQWLQGLQPHERDLWTAMDRVRAAEEHGEGADLIPHEIAILRGQEGVQDFTNYAVLGIPRPAPPRKATVRFRVYPDRPASDVTREYIELCVRFADDFERDHQALFGAGKP